MIKHIPPTVLDIYKIFQDSGYETYFVGGCVRNLLMGRVVTDWDLTTSATPEQILQLFGDGFYDNTFGTVGVPVVINEENKVVEITTFRTEKGYSNNRHPDEVTWGKNIEEDLQRRDFTVNAIAVSIGENGEITTIDLYNGQQDIESKILRAVGAPEIRFKEDALRLLRAIRFATILEFTIEENTWNEIRKNAQLITGISGERIQIELFKILASERPYEGIMLLQDSGLLQYIIPELLQGIGISQVRPGRHHTTDVYTHNVMSLKHTPSIDPVVRLAALLHDVGKPKVASTDSDGYVIFHNHEIVGSKIAREISDRLKLSKRDRDKIVNLIRWHMFTVDEKITDSAIRRFIRRVGVENVQDMMDLRIGDRLGGGTQTAESWRLKLFKKRIEDQLKPGPFSINNLAIDGNDIMTELKITPGRKIGELLQKLFEEVDEDLSLNTREYLIKRLKELA